MHLSSNPKSLLRQPNPHGHAKVTYIELFFDLVFVFAVTQLSHFLLEHLSVVGALQGAVLLLAVWWAWIYTAWVTNWLDPDRLPIRLMLFALMLTGLVFSAALPGSFDAFGLAFALSYVAIQLGRSVFTVLCMAGSSPANQTNFKRISAWFVLSALFWIGGAFAEPGWRLAIWALAIGLEYLSPAVGFWTPGLGRSSTTDWDIDGAHLAERAGLFVIIALGESLLVTGATFSKLAWTPAVALAFLLSVIGSIAMWWIYFNVGSERGTAQIQASSDPGAIARLAYTYIHLPIIAGIVLAAVADEKVLSHPGDLVQMKEIAVIFGGPLIFLVGTLLFKRATTGQWHLSHLIGIALLLLAIVTSGALSLVMATLVSTTILVITATWETLSFTKGSA